VKKEKRKEQGAKGERGRGMSDGGKWSDISAIFE